jgi:TrmH family RNA methyltransferase
VVEGPELLASALAAGAAVESVFVAEDGRVPAELLDGAQAAGARVFELAPGVLDRVSDTVHPQPVVAVVELRLVALDRLGPAQGAGLVVVCAELRDPGNAGTVVRTADAAGATAVVFAADTVDPTNAKAVRASAGSIFHLPLVDGGPVADVLATCGRAGYTTVGTLAHGGTDYAHFDWARPVALVLGNEAAGLSPEVAAAVDASVTVPLAGRAESLNVSAAAAVLCFEARRQRIEGAGLPPGARASATVSGPGESEGTGPTMPGMVTREGRRGAGG